MANVVSRDAGDAFVSVWQSWWAKFPIPESVNSSSLLRRIDLTEMLVGLLPASPETSQGLVQAIGLQLDEMLGPTARRWSPAPGFIDIHYGKLARSSAELKHSVLVSAIGRCVRERLPARPNTGGTIAPHPRLLDWDTFQAVCRKAEVRPDQIQILDVGETLFGVPDPDRRLSKRIWGRVDLILKESLDGVGYGTRYSGNRVLLFFPGYSKAMGDFKRKALADDIAHDLGGKVTRGEDTEADDTDEPSQTSLDRSAQLRQTRAMEDEHRAQFNQTFMAMAAARTAKLIDQSSLVLPHNFDARKVPMWWAKNRTVGGHVLEAVRKSGEDWERYFPSTSAEPSVFDLAVLARATAQIGELLAAKKTSLVVSPAYWLDLDHTRQRTAFLEFCSRVPEQVRHLLVIELAGIPEDLVSSRVDERIRQLRPFCRAVICRVRLGRRNLGQFKGLPVHAIGIDIGELPSYERGILPALDSFMDSAEPLKMKTFAFGLNTKSLLIAAQASGFDYIAGQVIPDSEEAPLGIRDFMISDLYDMPRSN